MPSDILESAAFVSRFISSDCFSAIVRRCRRRRRCLLLGILSLSVPLSRCGLKTRVQAEQGLEGRRELQIGSILEKV